ncbi:4'-phosphopantetheinyl transferase superfamily protein [Paenibacillus oenotherae]|uniref:4'-phosphopantetheinyl transferase superfamily protein n=1 Tax=Paenibacillus oenotherae TaxID=1435645 RepID=A0ABS7DBB8_9BACL|nr:4'-phosphopantetheinyl transferase superfamily protein [Paenibacillus oenotherae]MBW7476453.1 4'-phosphopantetheinyl transferase superfamily protein [Paenibacillus oenotherae]
MNRAEGPSLLLYAVNVAEPLDEDLQRQLTELCSPRRREGLPRFHYQADARRSLMGEMLLRVALQADWQESCQGRELEFARSEHGKPYLQGIEGVHYNLSHSGSWCVCAVSTEPVGVDVEQIKQQELAWVESHLSDEENNELRNAAETERLRRFFEIWTMKESYVKAVGTGLALGFRTFSVIGEGVSRLAPYRLKRYELDELHPVAVCAETALFPNDIQIYTVDGIGRMLR